MGVRKEKRPAFSRVELLIVIAFIAVSIGLLVPAVQKSREEAARTQTINNLKQLGTATHNFAGTYNTRMPANGTVGCRWASVFGHLLPFVEADSLYKFIALVDNTETSPAVLVTNFSDTSSAANANAYLSRAMPSFQAPLDATSAAASGLAVNGYGTASFASNGYLFNPGSHADVNGLRLVVPATQKNASFIQNPVPSGPRLPHSFTSGTTNVVMFATRYATCGADAQDNYWSSPTRTYFDNTYPQVQPTIGTTATPPQVLCNPAAAQGFRAPGLLVCAGDASVHTLAPNISATFWNRVLSPQYQEPSPPNPCD